MDPSVNNANSPAMIEVQLGDENCQIQARGKFNDKDAQDYKPNPESGQLRIDVPSFAGPLDLLLHLIKRHSMDIFDIPIVTITRKYVEALDEFKALDLDLAGDFLVMAATLTQIKSKMLLPADEQDDAGEDEDEEDPRAELVRRLIEYQKFKEAAEQFRQMHHIGNQAFTRRADNDWGLAEDDPLISDKTIPVAPIEVYELIEMFAKALKNHKPKLIHAIQFEKVSLRARLTELIEFSQGKNQFNFRDLMDQFEVKHKVDVIVTFLAVLEMARLKLLKVEQEWKSSTILLTPIIENLVTAKEDLVADLSDDEELN